MPTITPTQTISASAGTAAPPLADVYRMDIDEFNGIDLSTLEWFEDKETGRDLKRPAFDRRQRAVLAGRFKTVVVWKLDQISRCQRDGVNLLADWCDREVRVVAVM
jgi:DNA invertase Pin-like site-specific DNA recombinase